MRVVECKRMKRKEERNRSTSEPASVVDICDEDFEGVEGVMEEFFARCGGFRG